MYALCATIYKLITGETPENALNCTLRQWLNADFYGEAFSEEDAELICESLLTNPDNPEYYTDGGNDTFDKVFLLSIDEVAEYLPETENRKAVATAYSEAQGSVPWHDGFSAWWMRSPGAGQNDAANVNERDFFIFGDLVYLKIGVRPAMWIDIASYAD